MRWFGSAGSPSLMSARSRRLVLTSEARSVFRDILANLERHWGKAQRREYERRISSALDNLISYPQLGRARPEYGPGLLSFPVQQHAIVNAVTETGIRVVRVLHARRDAESEFEASAE